ncbi:MAG: FlgD immunoglobulin-like domain containing protein [Treponema sp.]
MRRILFFLICAAISVQSLCAAGYPYAPPSGGESANTFFSPEMLGGQSSVTGGPFGDTVPADIAVNPAIPGFEQRIIFDLSYALLAGFGSERGVKGHLANADFLFPARWGVIATDVHFFNSSFKTLPWGTAGSLRFSYSKDLTEKLSVGTGVYSLFGTGWGIGLDAGVLYRLGDLGGAKDSKLGVALTGIGKPYTASYDTGVLKGFPGMFTPRVGFASTFVAVKNFKLGMNFDLSFPVFMNVVFDTGLHMMFSDMVTLKTGWNFNLVETIQHRQTYIPSFAVACSIKLNSKNKTESNAWEQSDIRPQLAVKPFHNNIWAFGGGVNVRVGRKDTIPPVIDVTYPEKLYISPNNDGIQDVLEVPLSITDQRYVTSWECSIENDRNEVVRTITNKEPLRQLNGVKSFWTLLTTAKKGVDVPPSLRWDGILDSGEVAPDGTYYFFVSASDDNKNTAKTKRYELVVDNTPPSVTLIPPSGQNAMIFSPDGDGNKDTLQVKQSGSKEDRWVATVINAQNEVVRTVETKNSEPMDFVWDGKNTAGDFVPDGVYSYKMAATDRAGNSTVQEVPNIIVDTIKPSVHIAISTDAFSPNGDGVKDTIVLTPEIPVKNGLLEWQVDIKNAKGVCVHTISEPAKAIVFDGKDAKGTVLPEGEYQAVISARYKNGYTPSKESPHFVLDITPPSTTTAGSSAIFSPDGDGNLDTVAFTQNLSGTDSWTAEIFALDGNGAISGAPVWSFTVGKDTASRFEWDGRTNRGTLAADGKYAYRLTGKDAAGNTGMSNLATVELNTEKADVILSANILAFSPNGDGIKDTVVFSPKLKSATAAASYSFEITDQNGTAVKKVSGSGTPPAAITWDGKPEDADKKIVVCPDGVYAAILQVVLTNGQSAKSSVPAVTLDTVYPSLELNAPYTVFSTDSNAKRNTLQVNQQSSSEEVWNGTITASDNTVIRSYTWNGSAESFAWDGLDAAGNKVPDGTYRYTAAAEDAAGNKTVRVIENITIDSRVPKAYLTAELPVFSPNGDGVKDVQNITVHTNIKDGLETWSLAILATDNLTGKPVKLWSAEQGDTLTDSVQWNGKNGAGTVVSGNFTAVLTLKYHKGDELQVSSSAFISTIKAPEIGVSLSPKYFSPDNDGNDDELFINLSARSDSPLKEWTFEIREPEETGSKLFWTTGGKDKIAEQLIWDGRSSKGETVQSAMDYPFTFTVRDEVGMTSVVKGYIPIDVLVIRDGDKLKIAVPSIIFRKNAADFEGLEKTVVDKNVKVLTRIAEILNKFPEYKIQVEGHANNVSGTQKEELEDLIPLSTARADSVRRFLIEKGVSRGRLSSVGIGGTKPIASLSDRDNWWKNRRVEFVLIK